MNIYKTKFAEFCFDFGHQECRIADRPLSLFEGLARTGYFLSNLLNLDSEKFPALFKYFKQPNFVIINLYQYNFQVTF
jgi:hypothetical protein